MSELSENDIIFIKKLEKETPDRSSLDKIIYCNNRFKEYVNYKYTLNNLYLYSQIIDYLCETFSLEELIFNPISVKLDNEIISICKEKTDADEIANIILVSYINYPRMMDSDMIHFVNGLIE